MRSILILSGITVLARIGRVRPLHFHASPQYRKLMITEQFQVKEYPGGWSEYWGKEEKEHVRK